MAGGFGFASRLMHSVPSAKHLISCFVPHPGKVFGEKGNVQPFPVPASDSQVPAVVCSCTEVLQAYDVDISLPLF